MATGLLFGTKIIGLNSPFPKNPAVPNLEQTYQTARKNLSRQLYLPEVEEALSDANTPGVELYILPENLFQDTAITDSSLWNKLEEPTRTNDPNTPKPTQITIYSGDTFFKRLNGSPHSTTAEDQYGFRIVVQNPLKTWELGYVSLNNLIGPKSQIGIEALVQKIVGKAKELTLKAPPKNPSRYQSQGLPK